MVKTVFVKVDSEYNLTPCRHCGNPVPPFCETDIAVGILLAIDDICEECINLEVPDDNTEESQFPF